MVQSIKNIVQTKIDGIVESIKVLQNYLNTKNAQQDWHAVADVANDIRELNAEWKTCLFLLDSIEELENQPQKKEEKDEKRAKTCNLCRDSIYIGCSCRM